MSLKLIKFIIGEMQHAQVLDKEEAEQQKQLMEFLDTQGAREDRGMRIKDSVDVAFQKRSV